MLGSGLKIKVRIWAVLIFVCSLNKEFNKVSELFYAADVFQILDNQFFVSNYYP